MYHLGARVLLTSISLLCFGFAGCTAKHHRQEADQVAESILAQKQNEYAAQLKEPDSFEIESSEDNLRKQLIEDQNLQISHEASLGAKHLEEVDHWPSSEDYLKSKGPSLENQWMPDTLTSDTVKISMVQALQIAAFNNREYQTRKEDVFRAALRLDLEGHEFENSFFGLFSGLFSHDKSGDADVTGFEGTGTMGLSRRLKNGLLFTSRIGIDIASLLESGTPLTADGVSSKSIFADVTATMPLLRGGGKFVVTEPLKQAERNVVYALFNYETFKRNLAVQVASNYLSVLQQLDQVRNAEENYRSLIASSRRARRLADAGNLPEIQFGQAVQDELRARERWISSVQSYKRGLDQFKILLGLPTDARIGLDRNELETLAARARPVVEQQTLQMQFENVPPADQPIVLREPVVEDAGPYELPEELATQLALSNRLDLRVAQGEIFDSLRGVTIAANDLLPDLSLSGNASWGETRSIGSAGLDDSMELNWDKGSYTARVNAELPLERTSERNSYRESLIEVERASRGLQQLEDEIKLDIRNGLRSLLESRESLQNQAQAVTLAEKRVRASDLLLQAGRAEIRDLLEAQDDLLSAQNALTQAMVSYRVTELEIQRDMGLLDVNEQGLWKEFDPREITNES